MSSRMIHIGAGNWLALLAVGYLAMGAPLVHPYLHDHHGHLDGHGYQTGNAIQAAEVDTNAHDCLICQFLGTSHVIAPNPPPAKIANMLACRSLGGHTVSYGKSPTIPTIPRAPPLRLFSPIV